MKKKITVIAIFVLASILATLTLAQQNELQSISTFGTWEGTFSPDNSIDSFIIDIEEGQSMSLNVVSLSASLIPEFVVYDSNGTPIAVIEEALGNESSRISFPGAGQYRIDVRSQFDTVGDYIIKTRPLKPYTENAIFLPANAMLNVSFAEDNAVQRYNFASNPTDISTVIIYGEDFQPGVVAEIRNLETAQNVGVSNAPVKASVYCLPAGNDNYRIEIFRKDNAEVDNYNIAVSTEASAFCDDNAIADFTRDLPQFSISDLSTTIDGTTSADENILLDATLIDAPNPGIPPVSEPPISEPPVVFPPEVGDPVCTASLYQKSNSGNVRTLPSLVATVAAVVDNDDVLGILGTTRNNSWAQVALLDGTVGYASANILDLADLCAVVDIPFLWSDEEGLLRLEVDAGLIDLADINAALSLDGNGLVVTADGTVVDVASIYADATVNGDGIAITGDATVNNVVDVNADATVNNDGINVNADTSGVVETNVDASVDNSGINVNADVDNVAEANASVDNSGINVSVDVGDDDDDDIGVSVSDEGIKIDLPGDGLDLGLGG